jgi:hypothetical protein
MPRNFGHPSPDDRPPPIWPYILFRAAMGLIALLAWVLLDR